MTTNEAKQRICPFMFGVVGVGNGVVERQFSCKADGCMAWVKTPTHDKGYCVRLRDNKDV